MAPCIFRTKSGLSQVEHESKVQQFLILGHCRMVIFQLRPLKKNSKSDGGVAFLVRVDTNADCKLTSNRVALNPRAPIRRRYDRSARVLCS